MPTKKNRYRRPLPPGNSKYLPRGMYLEAFKFSLYVGIPIYVWWLWSDPDRREQMLKDYGYETEPDRSYFATKINEIDMVRQEENRKAYMEQMKLLKMSAQRSQDYLHQHEQQQEKEKEKEKKTSSGWWKWFGM